MEATANGYQPHRLLGWENPAFCTCCYDRAEAEVAWIIITERGWCDTIESHADFMQKCDSRCRRLFGICIRGVQRQLNLCADAVISGSEDCQLKLANLCDPDSDPL